MDAKSAFNNVSKSHLGRRMEALDIEADLITWTGSFMSDRQIKVVLDGKTGEASPVGTGISQVADSSNPLRHVPVWGIRRGGSSSAWHPGPILVDDIG